MALFYELRELLTDSNLGPIFLGEEALRSDNQTVDRRTDQQIGFAVIERQPADFGQSNFFGLFVKSQAFGLIGFNISLINRLVKFGEATAIAPDSTPTALIPAGTLNPSGVILETSTASPALSQLDVWKVSSKGVLLKSYLTVMKSVILPQGISVKSGIVTVSGAIASQSSDHFTISLSAAGIFESPIITSMKNPSFAPSKDVKTTLSLWKSFTTSLAIKGLPTWKPKPNSHVLVRYDLKTKAIVAAYLSSSQILDFIWEKNIGIVALLSNSTGYGLAIIK